MKDSNPSTQDAGREIVSDELAVPAWAAAEDLLVGAFLAQMGPAAAPPAVVGRSLELVRREICSEHRTVGSWSRARQMVAGLGWAVRGPALGLNVGWASHGASQTVQGLSMARYAFGTALLPRAPSPKRRRRWVSRLLLVAGGRP